jgi:hypothetical protein
MICPQGETRDAKDASKLYKNITSYDANNHLREVPLVMESAYGNGVALRKIPQLEQ